MFNFKNFFNFNKNTFIKLIFTIITILWVILCEPFYKLFLNIMIFNPIKNINFLIYVDFFQNSLNNIIVKLINIINYLPFNENKIEILTYLLNFKKQIYSSPEVFYWFFFIFHYLLLLFLLLLFILLLFLIYLKYNNHKNIFINLIFISVAMLWLILHDELYIFFLNMMICNPIKNINFSIYVDFFQNTLNNVIVKLINIISYLPFNENKIEIITYLLNLKKQINSSPKVFFLFFSIFHYVLYYLFLLLLFLIYLKYNNHKNIFIKLIFVSVAVLWLILHDELYIFFLNTMVFNPIKNINFLIYEDFFQNTLNKIIIKLINIIGYLPYNENNTKKVIYLFIFGLHINSSTEFFYWFFFEFHHFLIYILYILFLFLIYFKYNNK